MSIYELENNFIESEYADIAEEVSEMVRRDSMRYDNISEVEDD